MSRLLVMLGSTWNLVANTSRSSMKLVGHAAASVGHECGGKLARITWYASGCYDRPDSAPPTFRSRAAHAPLTCGFCAAAHFSPCLARL